MTDTAEHARIIRLVASADAGTTTHNHLLWSRKADTIAREKALDGVYIIRTSEPANTLNAEDAVRAYKQLGDVEKAFRTFKGMDLRVRPIHHRL